MAQYPQSLAKNITVKWKKAGSKHRAPRQSRLVGAPSTLVAKCAHCGETFMVAAFFADHTTCGARRQP